MHLFKTFNNLQYIWIINWPFTPQCELEDNGNYVLWNIHQKIKIKDVILKLFFIIINKKFAHTAHLLADRGVEPMTFCLIKEAWILL